MRASAAAARSFGVTLCGFGSVALMALVLAMTLGSESSTLPLTAIASLAAAAFVAITRQVHRPLIALLFFVAPLDLSKAVVAPSASIFYASGPYYSPGLYLTLGGVVLIVLTAVWIAQRLFIERRRMPVSALDVLVAAYAAWIWIRAFGAAQGALSLASAASYSLAILCFYVVSHALRREDVRLALKASALSLVFQVLDVFAQVVTQSGLALPGSKGLSAGGIVELGGAQTFRPPGTFTHPNSLAHYLVIVLTPLLALALLGPRRLPMRVWSVSVALLGGGVAALLATLSRGGWAAFALAALVVVLAYWRLGMINGRHIARGLAAVGVGAALVVAAQPNILLRLTAPDGRSLESRALLADMALSIIRDKPFVGVGFGDYNRAAFLHTAPSWALVSEDYHHALHQLVVHNHFLLIAAELGVPALMFFAYLTWRFIRLPWPLKRFNDPGRQAMAIGLSAGMVGQAFFLNSDNYYADIRIFLLWMSAGLLQAITLHRQPHAVRPVTTVGTT